jgi:spore germination cell wall hydrolase CwlJ-like protein
MKTIAFSLLVLLALPAFAVADETCKAYAVHKEARGESDAGKKAVLQVIENRMRKAGKTCLQIVSQPGQFSWYVGRAAIKANQAMRSTLNKLKEMPSVLGKNVVSFHNTSVKPKWKNLVREARIGRHIFYKTKEEELYGPGLEER